MLWRNFGAMSRLRTFMMNAKVGSLRFLGYLKLSPISNNRFKKCSVKRFFFHCHWTWQAFNHAILSFYFVTFIDIWRKLSGMCACGRKCRSAKEQTRFWFFYVLKFIFLGKPPFLWTDILRNFRSAGKCREIRIMKIIDFSIMVNLAILRPFRRVTRQKKSGNAVK